MWPCYGIDVSDASTYQALKWLPYLAVLYIQSKDMETSNLSSCDPALAGNIHSRQWVYTQREVQIRSVPAS